MGCSREIDELESNVLRILLSGGRGAPQGMPSSTIGIPLDVGDRVVVANASIAVDESTHMVPHRIYMERSLTPFFFYFLAEWLRRRFRYVANPHIGIAERV